MGDSPITPQFKVFGVRGSRPITGVGYAAYGGDTSSYTPRTPANSLLFLDGGTGMRKAANELSDRAGKVYLAFSHTHADHIMGLGLPNENLAFPPLRLSKNTGYEDKSLAIIGPEGIKEGVKTVLRR